MKPISELRAQALKVIPKLLDLVKNDDLDPEDREEFEDVLTKHIEQTGIRENKDVKGYAIMASVHCPFYANDSLAKHAGLARNCEPNGERMLAQGAVATRGALSVRVGYRYRDMLTRSETEGAEAWDRWNKQSPITNAVALNSSDSIDEIEGMFPRGDEMYHGWAQAIEPAVRYGLRVLPDKKIKTVLGKAQDLFREPVTAMLEGMRDDLAKRVRGAMNQPVLTRMAAEASVQTVGMYNFITREPGAGVDPQIADRNRWQALAGYKNLSSVFADFHSGAPSHNSLRAAIDRGDKIQDLLVSLTQPDAQTAIKAFLKADLSQLGAALGEINLPWLKNYVRAISQYPVQRYPKTAQDLVIATEMNHAADALETIGRATNQAPTELWEGLLKQGWSNAATVLARGMVEDLPETDIERAGFAVGSLRTLSEMTETVQETLAFYNREASAPELTKALLNGRGILRLMENIHEWRLLQAAAETARPKAPEGTLPAGCEWSPLLRDREITIGQTTFTEMVNGEQLTAEGAEMGHCVATYANYCRNNGYRIFKARMQLGNQMSKGTLSIVVNDTFNGHTLNQFRAEKNGKVATAMDADSIRLRAMIDDGSIPVDFDGARRDKLRTQKPNASQILEAQRLARYEALSAGLSFLMPPSMKGATLREFGDSEFAKREIEVMAQKVAAKEAQAEMSTLKAQAPKAAAEVMGFGFG